MSGEGSRGGHVVGHTSSGKPIYDNASHQSHKDFSHEDHKDALRLHSNLADKERDSHRPDASEIEHHTDQQVKHRDQMDTHELRKLGTKKSQGDDMNDIFKSMGITIGGAPSLLSSKSIESEDTDRGQVIRKGMDISARDRLDEQLAKGSVGIPMTTILNVPVDVIENIKGAAKPKKTSSEGLKNTHGEDFHTDNNKQVEEMVSNEEEIELSMTSAEEGLLFLKAMGDRVPFPIKKGEKVSMPKEKFVAEHKELVQTLKTPSKKDDKKEIKEQSEELSEVQAKKSHPFPRIGTSKTAPRPPKDPKQAKQERAVRRDLMGKSDSLIETVKEKNSPKFIANLHENSDGVTEKRKPAQTVDKAINKKDDRFKEYSKEWNKKNAKKSELDDLCDLIKGDVAVAPSTIEAAIAQPSQIKVTANNAFQFIKSAGAGGIVFDFGWKTGNPIADNATQLLNAHGDPTQMQIAQYQNKSYNQAISEYVNKGDQAYMKKPSTFGDAHQEWGDQLNKPMDQQVKEAFAKGELDNADPSSPAVKNDYNKTELKLGGQVIKATSETDAALINMMKADMENERASEGGFVADVGSGGRISITAGDPLPDLN